MKRFLYVITLILMAPHVHAHSEQPMLSWNNMMSILLILMFSRNSMMSIILKRPKNLSLPMLISRII